MANVIIGIIGVVLFILLAIAGAIFLGPQFTQSANNGKAAALIQGGVQIAEAADFISAQSGIPYLAGTSLATLVSDGSLKVIPINPIAGGGLYALVDISAVASSSNSANSVLASLGGSAQSAAICAAVQLQSTGVAGVQTFADQPALTVAAPAFVTTGCFRMTAALAGVSAANDYLMFARL